ncbi:hypothetical protein [Photobacterium damselae]|uniref:hypothetical protein n=1 Tax=Photobacterium damselae TaxID=38293 RepID=UPI001F281AEE|nr:hypothetical protein [Photobacterium damselae]UKA04720.1 hypothetical protein IHC89_20995 [Photobacterium damselae subsp. damselae]
MIGISRNKNTSGLHDRAIKKALSSQTKKFKNEQGKSIKIAFCSCCGNPVHNDDIFVDVQENSKIPLILCPLCFFPENLDLIPTSDSGVLIYAPELTQEQVNSVAIMVAYLRGIDGAEQDILELSADVDDLMIAKGAILTNILSLGANVPSIVCQFLYMLNNEEYNKRGEMLSSVRLYPTENMFKNHLNYLKSNVLKSVSPNKWVSLLQVVNKELNANSQK